MPGVKCEGLQAIHAISSPLNNWLPCDCRRGFDEAHKTVVTVVRSLDEALNTTMCLLILN